MRFALVTFVMVGCSWVCPTAPRCPVAAAPPRLQVLDRPVLKPFKLARLPAGDYQLTAEAVNAILENTATLQELVERYEELVVQYNHAVEVPSGPPPRQQ